MFQNALLYNLLHSLFMLAKKKILGQNALLYYKSYLCLLGHCGKRVQR